MSEKLTAKQAAEQLLYKPEYAADKSADVKEKAAAFAEGYKAFLNAAKTEREAAAASEKLLLEAGYEKFEPKKTYAPRPEDLLCAGTQGGGGRYHRPEIF